MLDIHASIRRVYKDKYLLYNQDIMVFVSPFGMGGFNPAYANPGQPQSRGQNHGQGKQNLSAQQLSGKASTPFTDVTPTNTNLNAISQTQMFKKNNAGVDAEDEKQYLFNPQRIRV